MKRYLSTLLLFTAISGNLGAALVTIKPSSPIAIPADFDGVFLDFAGDLSTVNVSNSTPPSFDLNFFFGGLGIVDGASMELVRTGIGGPAAELGAGATVSVASTFDAALSVSGGPVGDPFAHVGTGPDQFKPNSFGYLGFAYDPASSGTPTYGFFQVIFTDGSGPGAITAWRFQSVAGTPITISSIPEPATWITIFGVLVLAGLVVLRKFKATKGSGKV
ncbi:MAG: hypothetical protein AAFX93_14655 [Verrucomicrobiota bacterium]